MNLKQKYLSDEKHPFCSADLWKFFGYSRHQSLVRFVTQKIKTDLRFDYVVIGERKGQSVSFGRDIFRMLCENLKISNNEVINWHVEYILSKVKTESEVFTDFKFREKNYLKLKVRIFGKKGMLYNHSLSSFNVSSVLGIDHFDFYKFTANKCVNLEKARVDFLNQFSKDQLKIPFMCWDHSDYRVRYNFVIYLDMILNEYPLSFIQKEIVKAYIPVIENMLIRQLEYEFASTNKNKIIKKIKLQKSQSAELKEFYRKAAFLCHPDISNNGDETFKNLNNAYNSNDLITVKKIYLSLIKQ